MNSISMCVGVQLNPGKAGVGVGVLGEKHEFAFKPLGSLAILSKAIIEFKKLKPLRVYQT